MKPLKVLLFCCAVTLSSPTFAWTINANFDSGEIGTKADRGGDGFTGAGGRSIYTNEVSLRGQSAKLTILEGQTGWGGWGGEFIFPEPLVKGDTVWYQVHIYFPKEFDHYSYGEGERLKFMRLSTRSPDNQNNGSVDLLIDKKTEKNNFWKWIFEGENRWVNVGQPSDHIVPEIWESYQVAVTFDNIPKSDGGAAEVFIWKNGVLLEHIRNRKTLKSETAYSFRALLFTYWNGGSPKTQSLYVDEITITNEKPENADSFGNALLPTLVGNSPSPIKPLEVN